MVEFINKLEQFINQEEDKYPFGNTDLKHFLKFLKTNRLLMKLFSKTKNGKIQQWSIEVEDNRYRTHEGLLDGIITTSKWTECQGKNIGRSNETSPNEQVESQARSLIQRKIDNGYRETIEELEDGKGFFESMLAHKWSGELKETTIIQPKLDGMRCIVTRDGMFSRNGKPIVGAPHIFREIQQRMIFNWYPDLVIDGELYNHEFKNDFNEIISHARKSKPTDEDLYLSEQKLQYHIYDCMFLSEPKSTFLERFYKINDIIINEAPGRDIQAKNKLKMVETTVFKNDSSIDRIHEIDNWYQKYLEEGYEGQMIRFNSPYENKRSKNLLKRKEFIDQEFEILDIEEGSGNRSGMMGRIHFKTTEGRAFTASSRGNEDYYRSLLIDKHMYIGKMATVRYQNMTPDGSPRFPVVIAVRDYE